MKKPGKAALAKARALYDEGATPLSKIAASLGLSAGAFRALRKREDWPPRGAPQPPAGAPVRCDDALDTEALEKRLARALRREIARAESEIENAVHPGAERKARILGLLVKTLGDLRRLGSPDKAQAQKASDDRDEKPDEAPRDLATLREALAERLERLRIAGDIG